MRNYVPLKPQGAHIFILWAALLAAPATAADVGSEGGDLDCRLKFRVGCAPDFCRPQPPTNTVINDSFTLKYQASNRSIKACIANVCSTGTADTDQEDATTGIRVLTGSITWEWFDRKDALVRIITSGGLGHSDSIKFIGTVVSNGEVDDVDTIGGECR